jgi:predicted DNA-binding transcriptional regulator AlpA
MTKIIEQIQARHKKSILNKREVAMELGVSQATIDRLRKSGQLKSKRIGGMISFSIIELAAFLEA